MKNKRRKKQRHKKQERKNLPHRIQIRQIFETAKKLTQKDKDLLTRLYCQSDLSNRQQKLLKTIAVSYKQKQIKHRKYPGYNIPGYDIKKKQPNLIEELNKTDLQAV